MTSTTDTQAKELPELPAWIDLSKLPEARQTEINQRSALDIRGRAILPLLACWVRDAYGLAQEPDFGDFDLDDSLREAIYAHLGYGELDEVIMLLHALNDVFNAHGQRADVEMDKLRTGHPELFRDDDDPPVPNWEVEMQAAKNLLEQHGLVVTVPEGGAR